MEQMQEREYTFDELADAAHHFMLQRHLIKTAAVEVFWGFLYLILFLMSIEAAPDGSPHITVTGYCLILLGILLMAHGIRSLISASMKGLISGGYVIFAVGAFNLALGLYGFLGSGGGFADCVLLVFGFLQISISINMIRIGKKHGSEKRPLPSKKIMDDFKIIADNIWKGDPSDRAWVVEFVDSRETTAKKTRVAFFGDTAVFFDKMYTDVFAAKKSEVVLKNAGRSAGKGSILAAGDKTFYLVANADNLDKLVAWLTPDFEVVPEE